MPPAPFIHRQIAKYLQDLFAGKCSVDKYQDESGKLTMGILHCDNCPWDGVVSYSTIGLSDVLGLETQHGIPFGVELIGACRSDVVEFPNILASAAFKVIKTHIRCKPHTILENAFCDYSTSSTMSHLACVDPFIWDPRPRALDLGQTKTAWLQLIPISESELNFAKSHSVQAMLDRLEASNLDVLDINRASSV